MSIANLLISNEKRVVKAAFLSFIRISFLANPYFWSFVVACSICEEPAGITNVSCVFLEVTDPIVIGGFSYDVDVW